MRLFKMEAKVFFGMCHRNDTVKGNSDIFFTLFWSSQLHGVFYWRAFHFFNGFFPSSFFTFCFLLSHFSIFSPSKNLILNLRELENIKFSCFLYWLFESLLTCFFSSVGCERSSWGMFFKCYWLQYLFEDVA